MLQRLFTALFGRFAARLRFPQLFAVAALLFLIDLLFPDFVPFVDELMLGLLTLLLGSLKKGAAAGEEKPPLKDVTPHGG